MHNNIQNVIEQLSSVILGKRHQIKLALTCILARGHLLIEDLPGMGKTSLSHALANSFGLSYQRIQFTSDLLPADIVGASVFNAKDQSFELHQGPIFNQVVLADEINRAGPKTQSALLEAMEEHQVSIDGQTHLLPTPFFVIATQNPIHQAGTFALPESQLDRFLMRIELGFPDRESERKIILGDFAQQSKQLNQIISSDELLQLQSLVNDISVSDTVVDYILDLVELSRNSDDYPLSLSPRASSGLMQAAKAWAMIEQRDYVTPDDIKAVFPSVVEHRLSPNGAYNNDLSQRLLNNTSINF